MNQSHKGCNHMNHRIHIRTFEIFQLLGFEKQISGLVKKYMQLEIH